MLMEKSNELFTFLEKKHNENKQSLNEAAVRQSIMLPVFSYLGWNIHNIDEVIPEYSCGDGKIDYCLKTSEHEAFVEVKQSEAELIRFQRQILNYAFEEGASLAVLTNGYLWWFYLPLLGGNWEERKFLALDFQKENINSIVNKLNKYLSYQSVKDGSAIKNAKELYKTKENERKIETTIPKVWQKLLENKSNRLIELISEKVKNKCNLKPSEGQILDYLTSITNAASESEIGTNNFHDIKLKSDRETGKEKLFKIEKKLDRGKAKAKGIPTSGGFKVLKGSLIISETTASFDKEELKKELIKKNILGEKKNQGIFKEDYIFNSPSEAAVIVLGTSASGNREWKSVNKNLPLGELR